MGELLNEGERCIDGDIWHACAKGTMQMPSLQTKVFYFPQGHAEHSYESVHFPNDQILFHAYSLCTITSIKLMADSITDEVYAKINLVPCEVDNELDDGPTSAKMDNLPSYAKTLTQSDANNGGGFSVPRHCAEKIFPPLDFNVEPPLQTLKAKDVNGKVWLFRHIYRGTPRRHLLTTGWSPFVNSKRLVAGDSVVFFKNKSNEVYIGIRRARGLSNNLGNVKVTPECVVEAASLAAKGKPFEVVYFPRANMAEFCVRASLVKAAMEVNWKVGIRFKMAFEADDSTLLNWFNGAIMDVQPIDPIRWSFSPWRFLKVAWDEPDLVQGVKNVSPWELELEDNSEENIHSSLLPPNKKMRFPPHLDLNSLCGRANKMSTSCNDHHLDLNNPEQSLTENLSSTSVEDVTVDHVSFTLIEPSNDQVVEISENCQSKDTSSGDI